MKKIINIFYLLSIFLIVASCSDDNENVIIPSQVTGLTAQADYGAVILKWNLPAGGNIDYVNISYTIGDKDFSKNVSRFNLDSISGYVTATIDGFGDTGEYTFVVASCNTQGGKSEPLTVSQAPLPPAYEEVIKTISIVPDFGGGIISWVNETGKTMIISVTYPDPENPSARETITFTSETTGEDYITNLPADPITLEVTVSDLYENTSESVTFDITPLAESVISKDTWSVVEVDSEFSPREGYKMFDNDISTFWHTVWNPSVVPYPHYIIVDMGKTVTISRYEVTRRQNKSDAQTQHQLFVSMDGVTWTGTGIFDYPTTNAPESYRITSNPTCRYFKYEPLNGPNGYAHIAELTIYGQE